jgi:hypothetical protein
MPTIWPSKATASKITKHGTKINKSLIFSVRENALLVSFIISDMAVTPNLKTLTCSDLEPGPPCPDQHVGNNSYRCKPH